MANVVLFGDSILGRFNKDLIEQLEAQSGTSVYNCAVGGINSDHGAAKASFIAQLKPDHVVLCFGANDVAPWKEQVPLTRFVANMRIIIAEFAPAQATAILLPPVGKLWYEAQSIEFNRRLDQCNQAIIELSKDTPCTVLDLAASLRNLLGGEDYHLADGVHLNGAAYDILVGELALLLK